MKITLITLVVVASVLLVENFRSVHSYPVETTPEPTTTLSDESTDREYADGSEISSSWISLAQVGSAWNVTASSLTPSEEDDDRAPEEDDDDDDTVTEDSDDD